MSKSSFQGLVWRNCPYMLRNCWWYCVDISLWFGTSLKLISFAKGLRIELTATPSPLSIAKLQQKPNRIESNRKGHVACIPCKCPNPSKTFKDPKTSDGILVSKCVKSLAIHHCFPLPLPPHKRLLRRRLETWGSQVGKVKHCKQVQVLWITTSSYYYHQSTARTQNFARVPGPYRKGNLTKLVTAVWSGLWSSCLSLKFAM